MLIAVKRCKEVDDPIAGELSQFDRADKLVAVAGMPLCDTELQRVIDKREWLNQETDKLSEVHAEMDGWCRSDLVNGP